MEGAAAEGEAFQEKAATTNAATAAPLAAFAAAASESHAASASLEHLAFLQLTSTTAPGVIFSSREELALHYRSDWHRYNLKRKQAGLTPVALEEFHGRLAAAKQLRLEKQAQHGKFSRAHLKDPQESRKKGNGRKKQQGGRQTGAKRNDGFVVASMQMEASAYDRIKDQQRRPEEMNGTASSSVVDDGKDEETAASSRGKSAPEGGEEVDLENEAQDDEDGDRDGDGMQIEIDPRQCLFDRREFATVEANVAYMNQQYGFFVPDAEHLVDLSGLIGYCHEKIQVGRTCLWCQHAFRSARACADHMKSKLHTKIRYETGIDLEDLDVFYDFDVTNKDFLETLDDGLTGPPQRRRRRLHELNGDHCSPQDAEEGDAGDEDADEEDGEWEDVTDDEGEDRNTGGDVDIESRSGDDAEDEDEDYRGYEDEVRRMGLSVSDLGELVFPDGRTVGHRGLRRYYQQRLAPSRRRELALADSVRSARNAAAERLWKGRVYSVGGNSASSSSAPSSLAAAAAVRQKMHAASLGLHAATGRAGGGILVPTSSSPYDYSRLSVYRYRAAVRKARYGENYGRRLRQRANTNLNRMDKKANRIANGVSVAHAAR